MSFPLPGIVHRVQWRLPSTHLLSHPKLRGPSAANDSETGYIGHIHITGFRLLPFLPGVTCAFKANSWGPQDTNYAFGN